MDKRRIRRGIPALLLAAVLMLAGVLTGCSGKSAPTAQSLAEEASKKLREVKSVSFDEALVLDANIGAQGITVDLSLNMGINGDILTDPYMTHMKLKMDMSALGQSETVKSEVYSERNGDKVVTYTTDDGKNWTRSEEAMADADMTGMLNYDVYALIADGTIEATLDEETQKIGDADVYVIRFTMNGEQLESVMNSSMSAAGDAAALFQDMDLTDVSAPAVLYIDQKSGYPLRLEMDMSQLGSALFASAMGLSGEDYEIEVGEFSVRLDLSGYDSFDSIAIPDTVRSGAGEGEPEDLLEDIEEGLEETVPDEEPEEYEDYSSEMKTGEKAELVSKNGTAVITKPEGFDELRFSEQYASADLYVDGAMTDIFYYMYDDITMEQYLEFTDASYLREDADYTNVVEGKIQSGNIGGKDVKWKKTSFDFSSLTFIKYEIGVPVGKGTILSVEITCTNDAGTKQWFDEKKLLENVLSHIEIR